MNYVFLLILCAIISVYAANDIPLHITEPTKQQTKTKKNEDIPPTEDLMREHPYHHIQL